MFTIILLLVIAALCFAYLRGTQQTKAAQDEAKCWKLLSQMYWNWAEEEFDKTDRLTRERDDAYLSIELMALGLDQERRHYETSLMMVLAKKETP
jgi:hypothetical protein